MIEQFELTDEYVERWNAEAKLMILLAQKLCDSMSEDHAMKALVGATIAVFNSINRREDIDICMEARNEVMEVLQKHMQKAVERRATRN